MAARQFRCSFSAGEATTVTQVLEGSNDTYAVTLTTGIAGFHKTFSGANNPLRIDLQTLFTHLGITTTQAAAA